MLPAGKRIKTVTLFTSLIALTLLKVALTQGGQAAAKIPSMPDWAAPTLLGASNVIGAVVFIGVALLLPMYGKKWLPKLFAEDLQGESRVETGAVEQADEARSLTKNLALTVANLERYGNKSSELVQGAQLQTVALVELIKTLSRNSYEMAEAAKSFNFALDALSANNPAEIARAAGKVKDEHIRTLMLQPYNQTGEMYWQNISRLVAAQLGTAERWQAEYSQLASGLIAEVSVIKTRLIAVTAQIEAAKVARPLLQARVNLDETTRYLRTPSSEAPRPDRLFAPQNEYALNG